MTEATSKTVKLIGLPHLTEPGCSTSKTFDDLNQMLIYVDELGGKCTRFDRGTYAYHN